MALSNLQRLALFVIMCVMLAGCGQRGPLTLPDEADSSGTPAADGDAATDESSSDAADSDED